ncbi:ATPase [Bifidobacterium eulemuris]|uniref:ATPase n=2 Tax=Bifidobacterium eulemuris TaxID=1765219 RepID=A0A261FZS2_9BIFI|nr:ATPase [Bifidobacterium eulemuris]
MIERPHYLDMLKPWKDKDVIKVITGVRRCGKSTLMELWKRYLQEQEGIDARHIIHINLELLENEPLLEYHALHNEILSRCADDAMHYVLIDEIQNVPDFQKAVDSLYVRPNIDLYITGSNANLLGGTLATLLSGRYTEISMLPLSFAEYLTTPTNTGMSQQRRWSNYIHDGSFPAVNELDGNDNLIHDYLDGVLNTILIKDVSQRINANASLLRTLVVYLYDNIGNLTTPRNIANTLTSMGTKVSTPTVSAYLEALESAFVLYSADRYDVKGKRILKREKKYYAVDMGLRRILCSNNVRDTGRILENIVYLELLRRDKEVFVGQGPTGEIDFVTNGPQGRRYWQVCESVNNPETLERELSSFSSIRDNYPKTLITLDDVRPTSHDGIQQVYALDWLAAGK